MTQEQPAISVIVPTRNRADMLERFLPSLAQQSATEPYEVIVVDNGSTDRTQEAIAAMTERWPHVRTIIETKQGSAAACHAGAVDARAPLIMFVDDDMLAVEVVVEKHLTAHRDNPGRCVLGEVISAKGEHPFERMLAYIFDGAREGLKTGKAAAVDYWSGNVSLSRETYLAMGGYNQVFAQLGYGKDIDFGKRLLDRGVEMVFEPDAITYHHFAERFNERLRKARRTGYSYGYVRENFPDLPVPEVETTGTIVPDALIQAVCGLSASVLEPFDRGAGRPMKLLAYIYDLGIRTATRRGLKDYAKQRYERGSSKEIAE